MEGRDIVDRLTTRYLSVGSRMAAKEADFVRKANEGIAKANNKSAQATVATLKAEEALRVARAAARQDTMGLTAEMAAQQRTAEQLTGAFSITQAALKRVAQLEDELGKATKANTGEVVKQQKAFNVLRGALTEINSGFELLKKGANLARSGIEAVVGKPIDLATGFETGLAKIRTLGVDTAKGFEKDLLDLARRVPQTAGDITNAAFDAISAQPNKSLDEIVKLLDSASKVATGGSITLQDAVRGLTATTNAFKGINLDSARSADILFATMKQGVFTIDDLVRAQGSSLGVAAALKVSYEEVGATVAALTAGGIPTAAEAFTRLDAVMTLLSKPTALQQKAFKRLGITFGAADLQAKGFTGKLREIAQATGGSAEALSALTGRNKEAFQAISVLLNDGLDKYSDALQKITTDAGAAQYAFDQLDNTVGGQLARLSAEFEGLLIQVGKALLPTIRAAISDLQNAIAGDRGAAMVANITSIAKGLLTIAKAASEAALAIASLFEDTVSTRADAGLAVLAKVTQQLRSGEDSSIGFGRGLAHLGRHMDKVVDDTVNVTGEMVALRGVVGGVANLWGPFGVGAAAAANEMAKMTPLTQLAARAMNIMALETARVLLTLTNMPGAAAGAAVAIRGTISQLKGLKLPTLPAGATSSRRASKEKPGPKVVSVPGFDETTLAQARARFDSFLGSIEAAAQTTGQGIRDALSPLAESFGGITGAIRSLGTEIRTMGQNLVDSIKAGEAFEQNLMKMKEFGVSAANSLGMAAIQALWYGKSAKDAVADVAKALSAQAAFETLAALARGFTAWALSDPRAPGHFKAAGLWAATSAATGLASAALGGGSGSGATTPGGAGGTGIPAQRDFGTGRGEQGNVTTSSTVIVQNYGPVLATRREQEAQAFALVNRTSNRRGAPRIRQNVIRSRA